MCDAALTTSVRMTSRRLFQKMSTLWDQNGSGNGAKEEAVRIGAKVRGSAFLYAVSSVTEVPRGDGQTPIRASVFQ